MIITRKKKHESETNALLALHVVNVVKTIAHTDNFLRDSNSMITLNNIIFRVVIMNTH